MQLQGPCARPAWDISVASWLPCAVVRLAGFLGPGCQVGLSWYAHCAAPVPQHTEGLCGRPGRMGWPTTGGPLGDGSEHGGLVWVCSGAGAASTIETAWASQADWSGSGSRTIRCAFSGRLDGTGSVGHLASRATTRTGVADDLPIAPPPQSQFFFWCSISFSYYGFGRGVSVFNRATGQSAVSALFHPHPYHGLPLSNKAMRQN